MKSDIPKVLHPLRNKPLIQHVIDNLHGAGIRDIIVVVGYKGDSVIEAVGGSVTYVWQREQLGTGHAVMQAEELLSGYDGSVIVACGDVPLLSPKTFGRLLENASGKDVKGVVLSMIQNNPFGYGRIIKESDDELIRIVEEKDSNDSEKAIKEVNTGTYLFDSRLLFEGLKTIKTNNAQGEYYLPDVIPFIRERGYRVKSLLLENPIEGSGINSPEELNRIQEYLNSAAK